MRFSQTGAFLPIAGTLVLLGLSVFAASRTDWWLLPGTVAAIAVAHLGLIQKQKARRAEQQLVAEQRRALDALRRSENQYRALMAEASDGIAVLDTSGQVLDVNRRICSMVDRDVSELLGHPASEFIHQDEAFTLPENLAGVDLASPQVREGRLRRKDGSLLPVEVSIVRLADGRVIATARDISSRKRSEARVASMYETFLRFGPDPLANIGNLTALAGEVLGSDCAVYTRLDGGPLCTWGHWPPAGEEPEQGAAEGRICHDIVRRNDPGPVVLRDLQTSPYAGTDPAVTALGLVTFVGQVVRVNDIPAGAICAGFKRDYRPSRGELRLLGIVAGAIGVEERRRDAEQVMARQARDFAGLYDVALMTGGVLDRDALLQRLFEQLQSLIPFDSFVVAMYDQEHEEIEWVMAMEDGIPVAEITGTRSPMAEGWLTGWVMRNREALLVRDLSTDPLPAAARFDGGPTRSWLGVPLLAHTRLVGALSVQSFQTDAFDENNRRLLELLAAQVAVALENSRLYEQIRTHAQEMEQHVAARTAELQRANEKLRELDRLKSQFVSNVSHELRTPLTNIKLYLGLLERGKPEKRERYMGTMVREVDLLHHLIEGLLNLSRLDLGQVPPELRQIDPNSLISTLVADRAALAAERGLALEQELGTAVPPLIGDEKMLLQVLTNLISNAVNYTPRGGRVAVSTAVAVDEGRQWVRISVCDTGPGVPPEERELIFDRFYRGSAANSGAVAGTGLGLSICKELVALHHGQITLETPPEGGCCFTIHLPADSATAGDGVPGQPPSAAAAPG